MIAANLMDGVEYRNIENKEQIMNPRNKDPLLIYQ